MTQTQPLAYSMAGAVAASGMSRSSLDRAIRSGKLRAKKSGIDADGNTGRSNTAGLTARSARRSA